MSIHCRKGSDHMRNEVLTFRPSHLRGTDSNSLLRMYDLADVAVNESPFRQERAAADKAIQRIAKELQKRNVSL
jgi:hypothetical protein